MNAVCRNNQIILRIVQNKYKYTVVKCKAFSVKPGSTYTNDLALNICFFSASGLTEQIRQVLLE